ncbi:MAG: heme NO-binding domain-containing protein [Actinobacteria bacterium]|nr:heme NO-binding domain-containing protein [Actinomycetota bacterium]
MKGVIMACLAQLVNEKFGEDSMEAIMKKSGFDTSKRFMATEDVPEDKAMGMLETTCEVLDISLEQAADAFGEYWVNEYAPKIYGIYYKNVDNAMDFLLMMDEVHVKSTRNIENARPPRFEYAWQDDRTLIMTYKSPRGLIDICVGLIKGVGKYFGEELEVTKLSSEDIKVVFKDIPA